MRLILTCVVISLAHYATAPPPRRQEKENHETKEEEKDPSGLEGLGIEYERYLKEVIDVLESDPEFKKKLEAAEETDIRSGKIAHELEYVDHNVRSKLDEVKRAELERLGHLAQREFELTNGIDVDHMKIQPPQHLDHDNPHTFEINDLKKLIHKVTDDLNEADKKRRQEFKEYEMQKEFEQNEKLKHLEGAEKEAYEKMLKDNETKHKQHEPLHHPGNKAQLEEVWEKQDHMKDQEFNPKVFFQLHDLDGNGYWDQTEVKALFVKELDKLYQSGAPEDDMRERAEELERMREHVFKEADRNGDQLISYQEFLDQTKQPEFEKDPQWETIDQQQPVYTHEEYMEFERRRQQEIQHMIQQGLIPPEYQHIQPGYHPQMQQQFHQAGQHPAQMQHPGQFQGHPQQFQQQQQYHPDSYQQGHPQQFQQGHGQFQPLPPEQAHPNQQGQMHHQGQGGHPAQPQGQGAHSAQFQAQGVHPGQLQAQGGHPAQFQAQGVHPGQLQAQGVHPGQIQAQGGHPAQFQAQGVHPGQLQAQGGHPSQLQAQGVHPGQPQAQGGHPAQFQAQGVHPGQLQAQGGHPSQLQAQGVHPGQLQAQGGHPAQIQAQGVHPAQNLPQAGNSAQPSHSDQPLGGQSAQFQPVQTQNQPQAPSNSDPNAIHPNPPPHASSHNVQNPPQPNAGSHPNSIAGSANKV